MNGTHAHRPYCCSRPASQRNESSGLPEIDGNELARRLRAQPENQAVTLVAISVYGQESDWLDALSAVFNYHLVKPVDITKLVAILSEVNVP